jgi:hypothetical protein
MSGLILAALMVFLVWETKAVVEAVGSSVEAFLVEVAVEGLVAILVGFEAESGVFETVILGVKAAISTTACAMAIALPCFVAVLDVAKLFTPSSILCKSYEVTKASSLD